MVTADVPVVGFVPKVPVIPVGQLEAARVTAELKPLAGTTLRVDVPLAPVTAVDAVEVRVKLGLELVTATVPSCCHVPFL